MEPTLSINQKFTLRFIAPLREREETSTILTLLGFKFSAEPLTKDNCGEYLFAEGRKEMLYLIEKVNTSEAAFISQLFSRLR